MSRKKAPAEEPGGGVAPEVVPQAPPQQGQQGQRDKPAHTCRVGRIQGTVWRNEGQEGPWYSTVITRSYQDGQKNWKKASTFGVTDLLVVAEVARLCWLFVAQQTGSKLDGTGNGNGHAEPKGSDDPIPF